MKKKSEQVVSVIAFLILASCINAAVVNIYESIDINQGDIYGVLQIYQSADVPPVQTVVNMYGGQVTALYSYNDSVVNINGGTIGTLELKNTSTINIYGGIFSQTAIEIATGATLNVYGYDYEFEVDGGPNFIVSGHWLDGTEFSLLFRRTTVLPEQVNLLPEPATLLFLGLGGLMLRVRKIKEIF